MNRYFYFFLRIIKPVEKLQYDTPYTAGFVGEQHPSAENIIKTAKGAFKLNDDAGVFIMFMYEFKTEADFMNFTKKSPIIQPSKPGIIS